MEGVGDASVRVVWVGIQRRPKAERIAQRARGIERGEFRAVDPVVMTRVLIAPVLMLMMWSRSIMPACQMPPVDPHVFLDTFISTTLVGLEAPKP